MKVSEVFIRERLKHKKDEPEEFRTSFKWRKDGGRMVSGRGPTQEAADEACLEKIRERFRGSYEPLVAPFRRRDHSCLARRRSVGIWAHSRAL